MRDWGVCILHNIDNTEVFADPAEVEGRVRPNWLAVATGLNMALVISYLLCKPPHAHTLSWTTRLLTSVLYIFIACLAGTFGTWIALFRDSRGQFRRLVLWGARGWVFLPAMTMFLRERSIWAPVVAASAAAVMAVQLRRLTGAITHRSSGGHRLDQDVEKNIFITQLRFKPVSPVSIGVSLCIYGAFLSAVQGKLAVLTLLLGTGAFLLVSQISAAHARPEEKDGLNKQAHPYSQYSPIAAAFFCALIALSASSGTSDLVWKLRAFHVLEHAMAMPRPPQQHPPEEHSAGGYQAIVLWPIRKKEKVLPSAPSSISPSSRHNATPWVIPFYGPYWYFKTTGESPGPKARTTKGDPLKVNVRSTDSARLLMEAHQSLSDPVDLACCREMQVVFRNNLSFGATQVGILLTDSHLPVKRSQNLGIKYLALNRIDQPLASTSPVEETVSFPFPKSGKIRKFDQITVVLLPDPKYPTAGRKVAVEKFIMIPN